MASTESSLNGRLRLHLGGFPLGTNIQDNTDLVREYYDKLQVLLTRWEPNCVVISEIDTGAALTVDDGGAADLETGRYVVIRNRGQLYKLAAITAIDLSAKTCGGDTIGTSGVGVVYVFADGGSTTDAETPAAAQTYTSAVQAHAAFSGSTPIATFLAANPQLTCIGILEVTEGGSGAFTIGTDGIAAEGEVYYSLTGLPGVEAVLASFALDAAAATFTYGAAKIRLGSGTRVSLSGKANVTISGTNIAAGKFGAFVLYALADDAESVLNKGSAYNTLVEAQTAVREMPLNPLLPVVGVLYIGVATTASTFVPGTTNLDATGITCTFVKYGPGANALPLGEDALGQPILGITNSKTAAVV